MGIVRNIKTAGLYLLVTLLFAPAVPLKAQRSSLPRLAVVRFSVNSPRPRAVEDTTAIRDLVQSNIVASGKYEVIARAEIDRLLENQRIQAADISSRENVRKLQLLNISYIVTGAVSAMGDDYRITDYTIALSILDVATGKFFHSAHGLVNASPNGLYQGTNVLVKDFLGGILVDGRKVLHPSDAARTGPDIGDTGPGGGIIFLVEGNTWMEVSPVLGEYNWRDAAQAARSYTGGGLSGWRLPSQNEVSGMYRNFRANEVEFGGGWFWTSREGGNYDVWGINFTTGGEEYHYKTAKYPVRAVRSFTAR